MNEFIELRTTEGQMLYVRRDAIGAFEVAPKSQHVDGHVKLYVTGYKFLVQIEKEELLKKIEGR